MAAGTTVPYDTLGLQTADLVNNQWPLRPGEPLPKEYSRTQQDYGVHVNCHATQSFSAPSNPAGTAKRVGAFYEKTGVTQHRLEPGFRDTLASCTLTELPMQGYGTMRQSRRLPGAATLMLSAPALSEPERLRPPSMSYSAGYGRPGSGGAQSRRSRASSKRSGHSQRSSVAGSQRSVAQSQTSSVPSWAKRTHAEQMARGWNFEPLPMYERTNATYGKSHQRALEASSFTKVAGKSESGFIEPDVLIASLTRPEY